MNPDDDALDPIEQEVESRLRSAATAAAGAPWDLNQDELTRSRGRTGGTRVLRHRVGVVLVAAVIVVVFFVPLPRVSIFDRLGNSATTSATSIPPGAAATNFQPGLVVPAGSTTVYVLGSGRCGRRACLELWRGTSTTPDAREHFTEVTAPPSSAPTYPSDTGSIRTLVFANAVDGYALQRSDNSGLIYDNPSTVFATTDGGVTWHATSFGRGLGIFGLATSANEFYVVLGRCLTKDGGLFCGSYRLGRSLAGSTSWTTVPVPGTGALDGSRISLGAGGSMAVVVYQSATTGRLRLFETGAGQVPLAAVTAEPELRAGNGCAPYPMAHDTIWVLCFGGMTETWLRSTDGGSHFEQIWTVFQTSGAVFMPVSNEVAYRSEPTPQYPMTQTPIERTTDGGRTWTDFGRPPEARIPQILLDDEDGFSVVTLTWNKGAVPEKTSLMQTLNGGATWKALTF